MANASAGNKPLAQQASAVIALVNRMRDIGAHILFELPTIVFCGKQSSGKSSLIEAMSGVTLPRADGTCTRCPSELRLTETGAGTRWQAQIKLRWHWDDLRNKERSSSEFKEEPFEQVMFKKEQVEGAVRRAQNKLLNPSGNAPAGRSELKFSKNVVCIDIRGPNVGNLSIIDLPGLIQTVEKEEDERFIRTISSLVMEYIKKESTIIAMAISCKDDMENQAIKMLASRVDPDGQRTVGILTKPDTIEEGTHEKYLDILQNRAFQLRLGYYVVKNPSQKQINEGMTHEQARASERKFFQTEYPWNQVSDWSRFGSTTLQTKLGELLADHIHQQIPAMRDTILGDLQRTKTRLKNFAPMVDPNVAQTELLDMVCKLVDLVVDNVEANDGAPKDLFRVVSHMNFQFWNQLRERRPLFAVKPSAGFVESVKKAVKGGQKNEKKEMIVPEGTRGGHTVKEIVALINDERGRQLPGNASYEPTRKLVRAFVEQWSDPAQTLVGVVRAEFQDTLATLTDQVFGKFTLLHNVVSGYLQDLLDKLEEDTKKNVEHLLQMELDAPFTQNWTYLNLCKKQFVVELSHCLAKNPESNHDAEFLSKIQKLAEDRGLDAGAIVKQLTQPEIEESLEEVINVMATVMAYYQVSFKRFGDCVPMSIDRLLLRKTAISMRETLIGRLKLFESEQSDLAKLFHEDPHVVETRKALVARRKQLEKVWKELSPYCNTAARRPWQKKRQQQAIEAKDNFSNGGGAASEQPRSIMARAVVDAPASNKSTSSSRSNGSSSSSGSSRSSASTAQSQPRANGAASASAASAGSAQQSRTSSSTAAAQAQAHAQQRAAAQAQAQQRAAAAAQAQKRAPSPAAQAGAAQPRQARRPPSSSASNGGAAQSSSAAQSGANRALTQQQREILQKRQRAKEIARQNNARHRSSKSSSSANSQQDPASLLFGDGNSDDALFGGKGPSGPLFG